MKKILVFGFTDNFGGLENYYMSYLRKIDITKYQIDFVTRFSSMAFSQELEKMGCKIYYISNFNNPIKYYRDIKKILKNGYDIVHINLLSAANILPVIASKSSKIDKIIVHSHASGLPNNTLKKVLHKINKFYLKSDKFTRVACSDVAGKWMFGNKKFFVLNNAIDKNHFKYDDFARATIREKYGVKKEDFLIGHVGKYCEVKNQEFLINIMQNLVVRNKNIKLMLVGKGELESKFHELIEQLNIKNNVILVNDQKDISKFYSAFDLFVFPSLNEGLGIVALEAQASGLNCIFSENIPKIVDINDNVFINLENKDGWIKRILEFNDKKISRKFCNQKFAERGFDINLEFQKLDILYGNNLK